MSKTNQRKKSYYSVGRNDGFKVRNSNIVFNLTQLCKRLSKKTPKTFKCDWYLGWKAGLAGERSNTYKKIHSTIK